MQEIRNIITNLKVLNVKFKNLDKSKTNELLWDEIYNNNLYEINSHMLEAYFNAKNFWHKSYSHIRTVPKIKEYVDKNIINYFNIILEEAAKTRRGKFFEDKADVVLELLNNKLIPTELRQSYISMLKTIITNIDLIEDKQLWDCLLTNERVIKSVDNILKYFSYVINDTSNSQKLYEKKCKILISFIDSIQNISKLDFNNVNWEAYPNTKHEFYKLIIAADDMKSDVRSIIKSATNEKYELDEIDSSVIQSYVEIMINNDLLTLSKANCQIIIDKYEELLPVFIERNFNIFCEYLKSSAITLNNQKLQGILREDNVKNSIKTKVGIVNSYKGTIRYNILYPHKVLIAMLDHIDLKDLPRYFDLYDEINDVKDREKIYLMFLQSPIDDCKEILEKEHPQLYERLKNDAAFDKSIGTVANFAGIQKW